MSAMRRGDFAAAWRVSDAILQQRLHSAHEEHLRPRHLQQLWDGRALDGLRVLVRCYHGLGDTLQFVRLLPALRRRAREVIVWAQPQLLELLATAEGIDRLLALHDGEPDIARDADIELMELPHILRLDHASIPRHVPYLLRELRRRPQASARPRRVGIAWRAGDWDAARSITAAQLASLADVRGVEWYSLQYPSARCTLECTDIACRDLYEFARRMLMLDLVISVDTMPAHLAGALALPVWLLLPTPCDWRWMQDREDSIWYPTMRLFRQSRNGDWSSVIERVRETLATITNDVCDTRRAVRSPGAACGG